MMPHTTTVLAGLSVTGVPGETDVAVTLSTSIGTLAVQERTGVTLAYGNAWTGTAEVSFSGAVDWVSMALAPVELTQSAEFGESASVVLTARHNEAGKVYAAPNKRPRPASNTCAARAIAQDAAHGPSAAPTAPPRCCAASGARPSATSPPAIARSGTIPRSTPAPTRSPRTCATCRPAPTPA